MLFLRTRLPWTLEQASKIYPWLEIRVRFQEIGIFSIEPGASTTTKPQLSSNLQSRIINVTPSNGINNSARNFNNIPKYHRNGKPRNANKLYHYGCSADYGWVNSAKKEMKKSPIFFSF